MVSENHHSQRLDSKKIPRSNKSPGRFSHCCSKRSEHPERGRASADLAERASARDWNGGTTRERKRAEPFFTGSQTILERHPDTLFLIAGSGPEEKSLRRLAAELKISGSLTILPHLENFRQVFQAIDLFVLPELRQGSKLILLEAMAAGLPVVSSDIDGVTHIVDDGVTGILVPAADVEELSDKLHELLIHRNQAREIGRLGRDHIRENFLISKMSQSMLSIYQEILSADTNRD